MKILFDYQTFNHRFGGISRYHYELSNALRNLGIDTEIAVLLSQCEYLLQDKNYHLINPIGQVEFKGRHKIINYLQKVNKFYCISKLKQAKYDIFHPTYYDPYFINRAKKPIVLTIHDFIHEKCLSDQSQAVIKNKKSIAIKADFLIAISQNTKNDIIEYYGVSEDKIKVVYHGYNNQFKNNKKNGYGEYMLYVGRRNGYKNFINFIKGICPILLKRKSLSLICTGYSFTQYEISLFKELGIFNQTIALKASDLELQNLYTNAKVFVFPSLYEGFGMPILEAFAASCPVCLSNTSCFPEIAKDAGEYFDPLDPESIEFSVLKCLDDFEYRENLIKKGSKRLTNFSWDTAAKETIQVYNSLL